VDDALFDNLVFHAFSEYRTDSERVRFVDTVTRLVRDDPGLVRDHGWEWIARAGGFYEDNEIDPKLKYDWQIGQKRF
jgi:hypothetical protein